MLPREYTRCSLYVYPCRDNSPRCVGWDARVVDWSPFQQVYLFPPSSFSRTASSQKREVFSDGSFNCPVPEWPCFGSIGFQSKINAATSRFLFPTLVDRREEGKERSSTFTGCGYFRHSLSLTSRACSSRFYVPTEYTLCFFSCFRFVCSSAIVACCCGNC